MFLIVRKLPTGILKAGICNGESSSIMHNPWGFGPMYFGLQNDTISHRASAKCVHYTFSFLFFFRVIQSTTELWNSGTIGQCIQLITGLMRVQFLPVPPRVGSLPNDVRAHGTASPRMTMPAENKLLFACLVPMPVVGTKIVC